MLETKYSQFVERIKRKTGIDLSQYKKEQMERRLINHYSKRGMKSFDEYYKILDGDERMLLEFLDQMTINVTEFFRNPARWEELRRIILPRLAEENGAMKVWSAACSSGEEPYSLAMILQEMNLHHFRIDATDLDETVLSKARQGVYTARSLNDLPNTYKQKYFTQDGPYYSIVDTIKKSVNFKKQNLLEDRFDTNYDLILCRNVMIYFTEEAKDLLYQKLSDSLRPGGILFVGSTEQIFQPKRFSLVGEDMFFYRKV